MITQMRTARDGIYHIEASALFLDYYIAAGVVLSNAEVLAPAAYVHGVFVHIDPCI